MEVVQTCATIVKVGAEQFQSILSGELWGNGVRIKAVRLQPGADVLLSVRVTFSSSGEYVLKLTTRWVDDRGRETVAVSPTMRIKVLVLPLDEFSKFDFVFKDLYRDGTVRIA